MSSATPDSCVPMRVVRQMIPVKADFASLIRLAMPVAAVQVGVVMMGAVDTVMVGHVSARDLAAVALGNLFFFLTASFGLGTLLALDPVISQAFGAGDRTGDRARDPARVRNDRHPVALHFAASDSWAAVSHIPAATSRRDTDSRGVRPGFDSRGVALLRLHRAAPEPAVHGPGRSHRARHPGGQPRERPLQLGADLRKSRLSGSGCSGIGMGHDAEPLGHAPGAVGCGLARATPLLLATAPRGDGVRAAAPDVPHRGSHRGAVPTRIRGLRSHWNRDGVVGHDPHGEPPGRHQPREPHFHGCGRRHSGGRRSGGSGGRGRGIRRKLGGRPGRASSSSGA